MPDAPGIDLQAAGGVSLKLEINPVQLEELRRELSPQQYRQAVFAAVKRVAQGGVTDIRRILQQKTFISTKYVQRVVTARPPSGDPPVAKISISRKLVPLIAFKTSESMGGVTAAVAKDRPPLQLRHAFIATVRTAGSDAVHEGHLGVFSRARHLPTKGPNVGKGKLTPQGIAGRFAITEQFGPAVIDLISQPATFAALGDLLQDRLTKAIASQLSRFTGVSTFARDTALSVGE